MVALHPLKHILGACYGGLHVFADVVLANHFFELRFGTYHYPAFNVADSAIAIGAALIILDVLRSSKHHAPEVPKPEAS